MPKPATGELRPLSNGWEARVRIDGKTRRGFHLVPFSVADRAGAEERCRAMATMAVRLRSSGHADETVKLLEMAARARAGRPWEAMVAAVDALCGGRTTLDASAIPLTMHELGEQWRSGELHRKHRDHVKKKKETSISKDDVLARDYVDTIIGPTPVADVTLIDCEQVMANIPEALSASWRRAVAVYLSRLLGYAVYPLKLRAANPIPKGWLPRTGDAKAMECLYPMEDASLLGCTAVPLLRRFFYGVDDREGLRTDELGSMQWKDIDLVNGRIVLDENKTDDPRDWDLDPSVWRALKAWKERYAPDAEPDDYVFAENGVPISVNRLPYHLRRDLKKAGVTRAKLFEKSAVRSPIRAHDLRATMVTIALANGKSETWIADRTGHRSSSMIKRYRRRARTWNMGPLGPLDELIPELAPVPHERPEALPSTPADTRASMPIPAECRPIAIAPPVASVLQVAFNNEPASTDSKNGAIDGAITDDMRALVSEMRGMIADLRADNRRLRQRLGEDNAPAVVKVRARRGGK